MPSVTYNGQCLAIDNRRLWLLGASIDYARITPEEWANRIAAAKQAGFNTIRTCCPWLIHEPRKKKYNFTGRADIRRFIELCSEQKMFVMLQPGPFCGDGYDGGGIPHWVSNESPEGLRCSGGPYLDHASRFLRKMLGTVADLSATKGGPIILVSIEHRWLCGNDPEAERYMGRLAKIMRESGITVPLINNHDLWVDSASAGESIHTWRGGDNLLVHLRQLHAVQPESPRFVSVQGGSRSPSYWGSKINHDQSTGSVLRRVAEALAAGAQPIVQPFSSGTNFGFLAGRAPGGSDRFLTTSGATHAALGEAGNRGNKYNLLKRIITFANHFSHVFTDLNPEYHPIVLDLEETDGSSEDLKTNKNSVPGMSVVPQRGANGRVVFVFSNGAINRTTLLLDDGLRLPVHLGGQSVAWFVIDADLKGAGRLDYANICPWAIVNRRILVLHGPEKTSVFLSINGSPLESTVPKGKTPTIIEHQGLTVMICNQTQIDACYHDDQFVYVGAAGLDSAGEPIPSPDFKTMLVISGVDKAKKKSSKSLSTVTQNKSPSSLTLSPWTAAPETPFVDGTSPRFASLGGPETLASCGAWEGYGWYRLSIPTGSSQKRLILCPGATDRMHLFFEGQLLDILGVGPGANPGLLELPPTRPQQVFVSLLDNRGRFDGGNHHGDRKGLFDHWYAVKPLTDLQSELKIDTPVDPFVLHQFISGLATHTMSDTHQASWSFSHMRKTPIIVDIHGVTSSGTFVLNDTPIRYFAGASGSTRDRFPLHPAELESFKRGKNVLRFAPDPRQENAAENMKEGLNLYQGVETLTKDASWSYAKWHIPPSGSPLPEKVTKEKLASCNNLPTWYRSSFSSPTSNTPLWFDTTGLSKGQIFLNEQNLGRYFTSTATRDPVGPQHRLYLPASWLKEKAENEILVFDEHGADPRKTKLLQNPTGDLD